MAHPPRLLLALALVVPAAKLAGQAAHRLGQPSVFGEILAGLLLGPRLLVVEIQHANPYYDDSYAVNSANLGPYGDAIVYELIPYLEEKYRGLGEGWARFM